MFYGAAVFDPWLIIGQMLVLQCTYYLTIGALLVAFNSLLGTTTGLGQMLSGKALCIEYVFGWPPLAAAVCQFPVVAGALLHVVGRAKKCLDFVCTLYLVHFFLTVWYDGFPAHWEWWLANVVALVATVVLGEYWCMRKEMEYIPLYQHDALSPSSSSSSSASSSSSRDTSVTGGVGL